jgi:predicted tellurium resistance membrane protein TerC
MFDFLANPETWVIALLTLTVLEIVLGIDNIVFISILVGKLPAHQQDRARIIGLSLAMFMRIALLFTISWVIGLTAPLFNIAGMDFSGRDLILIGGGLFLLWKATFEIHDRLEGEEHPVGGVPSGTASFAAVIAQILALDLVFSLDSVITAVGMAEDLWVMVTAVVIAVGVMLFSSGYIATFVNRHPTVKMLALSFLLLIGMSLVAEGLDFHIPKGYIYFAMGFSVFVEILNLRIRGGGKGTTEPVHLRDPYHVTDSPAAGPTPPLGAGPAPTASD